MDRFVIGILVTMAILTSIVFIMIYSPSEEKIVKVKEDDIKSELFDEEHRYQWIGRH